MSSLRFELLKIVDCCINLGSTSKAICQKIFRALFKDTRKRPKIFAVTNLVLCTAYVLTFNPIQPYGIKRPTDIKHIWTFIAVNIMSLIMGIVLIYSHTQRKHSLCKVWCLVETSTIFIFLLLTLSESVILAWPALGLLIIGTFIKLYGLWVMYYFSLEVENSSDRKYDDEDIDEERLNVKYLPKRTNMIRRDTDQTSIASSPLSPGNFQHEHDDSVIDDNSPTAASLMFFPNENIFEEQQHSPVPSTSKDNIIISDLMCGGSSTLNAESES